MWPSHQLRSSPTLPAYSPAGPCVPSCRGSGMACRWHTWGHCPLPDPSESFPSRWTERPQAACSVPGAPRTHLHGVHDSLGLLGCGAVACRGGRGQLRHGAGWALEKGSHSQLAATPLDWVWGQGLSKRTWGRSWASQKPPVPPVYSPFCGSHGPLPGRDKGPGQADHGPWPTCTYRSQAALGG